MLRNPLMACAAIFFTGCAGIQVPPAQKPVLLEVKTVGSRVCGSLTASGTTYDITPCDPLPTTNSTAWLLPPTKPKPGNSQLQILNRGAVAVVKTPPLTSLEVAYFTGMGRRRVVLSQVAPGLDHPTTLRQGGPGEVAVSSQDDGTDKTWQVAISMSGCSPRLPFEIVNLSTNSVSRSEPLAIDLIRDSTVCGFSGASGGGGGFDGVIHAIPLDSLPPPPPASECPGGGARREFAYCITCPRGAPQLAQWVGYPACTQSEANTVIGVDNLRAGGCSVDIGASRQSCEGH